MVRAIWNGTVIAEADTYETVDGNVYFPPSAVKREYLSASDKTTSCHWKGIAHYYTVAVDGVENRDSAWYYPDPKPAAARIAGHIAFWRGVEVEARALGRVPVTTSTQSNHVKDDNRQANTPGR